MSTFRPLAGAQYFGAGGLVVQGALIDGKPHVIGQWGSHGLGYSTTSMREAAAAIVAACDEADAMAARQDGEPNG